MQSRVKIKIWSWAAIVTALVLILALAPRAGAQTGDGYVGIYADAAGTTPCAAVPPMSAATLYVIARLAGQSAAGITGAEFRIEVPNPTGWYISYNGPTGGNKLGDPIDTDPSPDAGGGLNLTFATCQQASGNGTVALGTISVFNASGTSTTLLVKGHSKPTNANYDVPLFTICDAPRFSKVRMSVSSEQPCVVKPSKTVMPTTADPAIFTAELNDGEGSGGSGSGHTATFTPISSFQGQLPIFTPWSPTGSVLAFYRNGSLFAYDASQPSTAAWQVLETGSEYVSWSPDGQWISCLTQSADDSRKGLSTLVAAPIVGGTAVTLISRADIQRSLWATNGNVYYWDGTTGQRKMLSPPNGWIPQGAPFPSQVCLVTNSNVRLAESEVHSFVTSPNAIEITLSSLQGSSIAMALPQEAFVDGRQVISVYDTERGVYTLVVDESGDAVADLGNHTGVGGFTGTSVSANGAYVVGHDEVDDGNNILSAKLYVADSGGAWRILINGVPTGLNPRMSRIGSFLAYEEPESGVIHVGTLVVTAQ